MFSALASSAQLVARATTPPQLLVHFFSSITNGIPIPKAVAALDGRITSFGCRKQRHGRYQTRVFGAHGYALSKFRR